jgi:hypothetical protein
MNKLTDLMRAIAKNTETIEQYQAMLAEVKTMDAATIRSKYKTTKIGMIRRIEGEITFLNKSSEHMTNAMLKL